MRNVTLKLFVGCILILAVKCFHARGGESLALARDGKTDYVIVEGAAPTAAEKYAAGELRQYLEKVTGASFKVVPENNAPDASPAFYVGWTSYAARQGIDLQALGDEEWIIRNAGKDLILTGGRPRGTLYAVYEFLEQQVGCHWFDENTESVPARPTLTLGALAVRGRPVFRGRQIYTGRPDSRENMILRARNKDTRGTLTAEFGFGTEVGGHNFVAYSKLFPQDRPEYLGMNLSGERPLSKDGSGPGQICLTNPEVRKLVLKIVKDNIARARQAAAEASDGRKPPRTVYLNPNDTHWNCQCPECKAFAEREQADSGPLIDFVNSVADGIKDEYPDMLVGTFAYANNIKPPKTVRPRPNVSILMAQLNAEWVPDTDANKDAYPDLFRPLTSPVNRHAAETVKKWSDITSRMEYWTYWVLYGKDKFPTPYTNLHCLQPTLKLLRDLKTETFFTEFTSPETRSFFALTCWVGWKLMQNPDQETAPLVKTFMEGYYGPAAGKMTEYLNYMEKRILDTPEKAGKMCAVSPMQRPYLDLDFYLTCQRLLDEAEALCETGSPFLLHVRQERIPVDSGLYCMWEPLKKQLAAGQTMPWKPADLINRYRDCRLEQLNASSRGKEAIAALERDIVKLKGLAANRQGKLPPIISVPGQADDKAAGDPAAVDWKKGNVVDKWSSLYGTEQPERKIAGYFTRDGKYLYVMLEEKGINIAELSNVWWAGDGWELFFSPGRGGRPYRQLAVNPEGKHYAFDYKDGKKTWDSGVVIKSDAAGDCWRVSLAIPLAALRTEDDIAAGRPLFINIFRVTRAPGTTMCLSPVFEANFHDMTRLAELRLDLEWPDGKDNLVLGRSYTLSRKPSYSHCSDPAYDPKKLTDGNFSKAYPIWFDKRNTLGFSAGNVEILFDLETVKTIGKVFFHTAAGISGVVPPKSVKVYGSEDGKNYSLLGEEQPEAAEQSGYKTFTIGIPVKKTSVRYIRIAVSGKEYVFCDELAVAGE